MPLFPSFSSRLILPHSSSQILSFTLSFLSLLLPILSVVPLSLSFIRSCFFSLLLHFFLFLYSLIFSSIPHSLLLSFFLCFRNVSIIVPNSFSLSLHSFLSPIFLLSPSPSHFRPSPYSPPPSFPFFPFPFFSLFFPHPFPPPHSNSYMSHHLISFFPLPPPTLFTHHLIYFSSPLPLPPPHPLPFFPSPPSLPSFSPFFPLSPPPHLSPSYPSSLSPSPPLLLIFSPHTNSSSSPSDYPLFSDEPPHFFVEAGALDGEFISNTLYLEQDLGWTGLLVEADPLLYAALPDRKNTPKPPPQSRKSPHRPENNRHSPTDREIPPPPYTHQKIPSTLPPQTIPAPHPSRHEEYPQYHPRPPPPPHTNPKNSALKNPLFSLLPPSGKNRKSWSSQTCLSPSNVAERLTFETYEPRDDRDVAAALLVRSTGNLAGVHSPAMGQMGSKIPVEVQCFPLFSYLLALNATSVGYVSLDVEGAEAEILLHLPWDRVDVKVWNIEHRATNEGFKIVYVTQHDPAEGKDPYLVRFMREKGYRLYDYWDGDYTFVKADSEICRKHCTVEVEWSRIGLCTVFSSRSRSNRPMYRSRSNRPMYRSLLGFE
ncbi:hypothetical protein C7M84_021180 [Penaeus vannamei]|uniref:Methyltransferase FkbM domain-containing protein n=1 Tax=Penaeus vannamei TaxID=6689 RepID=A0A423SA71_PENVA|nr:hypothetical protein C7M84_021180 [Penaeus vannamei]